MSHYFISGLYKNFQAKIYAKVNSDIPVSVTSKGDPVGVRFRFRAL